MEERVSDYDKGVTSCMLISVGPDCSLSDEGLHCLLRSVRPDISCEYVSFYAESLWLLIVYMPDDRISSF